MASQSKESRIILAIQAMQQDKNLSRRRTAKIYDVPETTLRDRMKGKTPKPESRPAAHRLTVIEEEVVVQYILDLDMRGFGPRALYQSTYQPHHQGRVLPCLQSCPLCRHDRKQ